MTIRSIALLAAAALISTASVLPAAAFDAAFTKKPKPIGSKIQTVTTYSSGSSLSCSGTCFSDHVTRYWKCDVPSNATVHCHLSCNPPKGGCSFE